MGTVQPVGRFALEGASVVTDRRQFLASLAALPLSAAAGHQPYTASLAADLSVPCPDPTPGTVTNQSGSVDGAPLTDLVDAYSQVQGVNWQHQLYSVLTNNPNACAHYRQYQVLPYERWLLIVQTAWRSDQQPAPFATGNYQIGAVATGTDGTLRIVTAVYKPHGPRCAERAEQEARNGTVTYASVSDTTVEGTYDLEFRSGRVQGSFTAPMCLLCAPRPTSPTCLTLPT
jgi:hypothetical protein